MNCGASWRVFDSDDNAKAACSRALGTVVRQRGEELATFQQGIVATGGREDVTRRGHRSDDTTYRDSNSHYRQTCCATFYDFFVPSLRAWPSVDEVLRHPVPSHFEWKFWRESFEFEAGSSRFVDRTDVMDGSREILISRFEKEVIRSIFDHKDSWINFMEFWFLVLRRKWFVRFLIKIRGWNVWWMDQVKFHGILIFALQKKWFVWFLCLWRSSDLKVMWFLFMKIRKRDFDFWYNVVER